MIEEDKAENQPAFLIHGDVAAVADTRDKMQQTRLKLLLAAPGGRIIRRGGWVWPGLAILQRRVGGLHSILDPVAIVSERIDALAVILLHS